MKLYSTILLLILLVSFASTLYVVNGALTQEEAKALFDRLGCRSCHRDGGIADSWPEILSELKEWGDEYSSIDDAVSERVTYLGGTHFSSFDDLLRQMQSNVGASDEDIAKLKDFFLSVFEGVNVTIPTSPTGNAGVKPQQGFSPQFMIVVLTSAAVIILIVAYLVSRMGGKAFMTDGGEETDALKFLSIYLAILIIVWIVILLVLVSRGVVSG